MEDGKVISKRRYPSPHPQIALFIVTYVSQGLKIKGLLAEPKDEAEYDAILYLRGGIRGVGQVRPGRIIQFASHGFIVFAPFYRGNRGGEGDEDFAGNDRVDAFSAYQLLQQHKRVKNIHLFGFSRGGVMALFTAIHFSDVASVVTWGGVSDMFLTYKERIDLRRMMKRVIGGTPNKYPDRYRFRTPLFELNNIDAPVLIIHGEQDAHVSVEHAYRLEKQLKALHKEVDSWYFPQFTHYFPPSVNRMTVQDLTNWMKKQTVRRITKNAHDAVTIR